MKPPKRTTVVELEEAVNPAKRGGIQEFGVWARKLFFLGVWAMREQRDHVQTVKLVLTHH